MARLQDFAPFSVMVYDQTRTMHASRAEIWPWMLQLGKGRGGWYCPASWEKWMPQSWRATRSVNPAWQDLKPGDRVDDYGFSVEDYFDVVAISSEEVLIYRSDRYGARFTWTLMLHELDTDADGTPRTLVHLRFRGQIAATGIRKWVVVNGGGFLDWIFTYPMLLGMQERAERPHVQ
ncbi:hypothetical protein LTR78_000327 [Recurvomyces mirabilis]|uniref:Uncharacterized protein n=1 Tax=Recurvomyces mirabilis TaxID=574656 RepID=A0AAE0WX05_9PEZI|nr:hypothetical protein LTR78_000327 [Recurvomyces mirabilis]KAK5161982.1 hypothetical protein LTS14_000328 [Recurvomyces mirabilis]